MIVHYIEIILIYLPIIFSSYYLNTKITRIELSLKNIALMLLFSTITLSICIIIDLNNIIYNRLIFMILNAVFLILMVSKRSLILIPISIITTGISYCIKTLCMVIIVLLFWSINFEDDTSIFGISILILNISLTIFLSRLNRFKSISTFINSKNNLGIGLIISGFIIIAINLNNFSKTTNIVLSFLIIGLLVSSIGLFLWIRKSITEHYRKKLQAKADKHYQNTLAEKEQQIEQLNNSNSFLSKIVHRDNHIMSSLQHTITKYKDCDNPIEKEKLMNEILTLAQERSDLIVKEQANTKVLPTTGISLIDGALSNMYIKATAHNIDFNLIILRMQLSQSTPARLLRVKFWLPLR